MFEFIQLCITLINMVSNFINTKYESNEEQHKAFDAVMDYFYQVVCKVDVYQYLGSRKFKLAMYWRYTTEAAYRQAAQYYFGAIGGDVMAGSVAFSSVTANQWASRLGYEVVGV